MASGLTGRLPSPGFWLGKRVFLTGHTGFKGAWLAVWLRRLGAEVTGFALPALDPSLASRLAMDRLITSVHGDIRDAGQLSSAMRSARPEIVLHLAAQSLVRESYRQPVETFATNVMGTVNLLHAMQDEPELRAAVIVTTDKCYENREWIWPYREIDRLGGHDPYSASKACAEIVTAAWRRSFLSMPGAGRPLAMIASARAGNVIGGGDWAPDRLVPDCIRAFIAGAAVRVRNPGAIRPWQHVLEPLCGYLLLAENLVSEGAAFAQAWNFGPDSGGARSVADVVKVLADGWGGTAAWREDGGNHPHEANYLTLDSSAARSRLNWLPRLDVDLALAMTVQWYKQHAAGLAAEYLVAGDLDRYEMMH